MVVDNNNNEIKQYNKSEQVDYNLPNKTGINLLKSKKRTYNEMMESSKNIVNEVETNNNNNKNEKNENEKENIFNLYNYNKGIIFSYI